MLEKIRERHVVATRGENEALLYIDRNLVHEGSFHAFGARVPDPAGIADADKRAHASSSRNFEGRQGKGARTHLMSPARVAAAAINGRITDVRSLLAREPPPPNP